MSTNKRIHIISLDVPFPADYGGVVDIYHRIRALHSLGYAITLHCFEYGRGRPKELEELAETVFYYKRKKKILDWFNPLPFIVQTRKSSDLLSNLLRDTSPILFEGLHTTYLLKNEQLKDRVKIVRMHNIEHDYYAQLATNVSGWKRRFYLSEAKKLQNYEATLAHADHILAIKSSERDHFSEYQPSSHLLPPCIEAIDTREQQATEPFALFHGNLSVAENERAVQWLVKHIVPHVSIRIAIAGKNPSAQLQQMIQNAGVELHMNPSNEALSTLLSSARIHLMRTDQATGVKLKLMHAGLTSGHIVANSLLVDGSQLNALCVIAETPEEWIAHLSALIDTELPTDSFVQRQDWLTEHFNTTENCRIFDRILSDWNY